MHIQSKSGTTCARAADLLALRLQWTAESLSCNSDSPLRATLSSKQIWQATSPSDVAVRICVRFQRGRDLSLHICLSLDCFDGSRCKSLSAPGCEWENLKLHFTLLLTTFALKGAAQVFCTSLWTCTRQYTSAVQQQCAYFKGVDGFPLKAHGSSKRSVKLASEGESACWGLCHFIAHWLKMSAFILGMLHLRGISGKAVPFCSMSEYPPGCQSQKCCSVQKEKQSWALEVFVCLVCVLILWTLMFCNAWWLIF